MYEIVPCTEQTLFDKLNGSLQLGPFSGSGILCDGLTLNFTSPTGVTITFAADEEAGDVDGKILLINVLQALIMGVTGLHGSIRKVPAGAAPRSGGGSYDAADNYLILWNVAASTGDGVEIDHEGTANVVFGLSDVEDTSGPSPLPPAQIVAVNNGALAGHYLLVYSTESVDG